MYPTLQDVLASVSYANPLGLKISLSFFIGTLFLWKFRQTLARNVYWILAGMVLFGLLEAVALAKAVHDAAPGVVIWEGLNSSTRLELAKLPLIAVFILAPVGAAVGLLCLASVITSRARVGAILLVALSLTYFGLGHWFCEVLLD